MELKYRITETKASNFIKEIHLFKTVFGYKVVLNLKHRYFEIIAESSDENSQGFILTHNSNEINKETVDFSLFNFTKDQYEMIISKDKDDIYLYFLKEGEQDHIESEVISEEVANNN